tara:strand:+ start:327 stop:1217 length:891 start_codon:yes stop_codon:yes gene_type:complete
VRRNCGCAARNAFACPLANQEQYGFFWTIGCAATTARARDASGERPVCAVCAWLVWTDGCDGQLLSTANTAAIVTNILRKLCWTELPREMRVWGLLVLDESSLAEKRRKAIRPMPPLPLQENVLNAKKHPTDACKEPRRCESSTPSSSFARAVGSAPDPILSVGVAYEADSSPYKINLGIGAYRSADGSAYVLPSVQEAEAKLLHSQAIGQLNKEYLPSQGLGQFCEESVRLLLGDDCAAIAEGRVATVQSISGTGGFHLAARIISELFPGQPYQPNTRTVLSQYCHQYEFARAFP